MTKTERLEIIERLYIRPPKSFKKMTKEQFALYRKELSLLRGLPTLWDIDTFLVISVGLTREELEKTRKEAKGALNIYLLEKKRIKDNPGIWCKFEGTYLKELKSNWVNLSKEIKALKKRLYMCELRYNRRAEWLESKI